MKKDMGMSFDEFRENVARMHAFMPDLCGCRAEDDVVRLYVKMKYWYTRRDCMVVGDVFWNRLAAERELRVHGVNSRAESCGGDLVFSIGRSECDDYSGAFRTMFSRMFDARRTLEDAGVGGGIMR